SAGGMLMVGMNVLKVDFKALDKAYFTKILSLRLISAILLMGVLVLLEYLLVDQLEGEDRQMLALIPFFPIAANVTVYASFIGSKEEQSGILVLLTVGLSLLLVPLVAMGIKQGPMLGKYFYHVANCRIDRFRQSISKKYQFWTDFYK